MSNKSVYCYFGRTLFRMDPDGNDYWVNPAFNDSWQYVDGDHGPHPCFSYPTLTEEEALEFAKNLGMSIESFKK